MLTVMEQTQPFPDSVTKIRSQLLQDAIWVGTDFFDRQSVEAARNAALSTSLVPDRVGAKRLIENADDQEVYQFFFRSPVIATVMSELIGDGAISRRNRVQDRVDHFGGITPITLFHIDSAAPRFKVFLYLSDVGDDDGPFEFLRGSHQGNWRARYVEEVRHALEQNATDEGLEELDYSGCLRTEAELTQAMMLHELSRVTGSCGTCILFDTRGFHRASPMRSGSRIMLSMDWMGPDLVI